MTERVSPRIDIAFKGGSLRENPYLPAKNPKESCQEMIKLGFMQEVKDKDGNVCLKLNTYNDSINKDLDKTVSLLKLL